jgi:hypothetical protein
VLRPSDRYLVNRPLPPKPGCQAGPDLYDSYKVEVARRAVTALSTLLRRDQQRIRDAFDLVADEPRPPGATESRSGTRVGAEGLAPPTSALHVGSRCLVRCRATNRRYTARSLASAPR